VNNSKGQPRVFVRKKTAAREIINTGFTQNLFAVNAGGIGWAKNEAEKESGRRPSWD
jgi:hypothetical protein